MTELTVREFSDYDTFAQFWHQDELSEADVSLATARDCGLINEDRTRLWWQLLGQLGPEEVLVEIPEWLAEEKAGYTEGSPPTEVIGRIDRETDKAVLLADSAAARPLLKLAHRIHELEENEGDPDRNSWLDDRLQEHRREFQRREDVATLSDEWLPKSQLLTVVRRRA